MNKLVSLGVMTGTSCDGIDIAALEIGKKSKAGGVQQKLLATGSKPFTDKLRLNLLAAQSGNLDVRELFKLNQAYSQELTSFLKFFIKKNKIKLTNTLVSVHGQTIWHSPPTGKSHNLHGYTVQLIDPAIISCNIGCTVTAYFRQPDMALGGQGAPLVPFFHWLMIKESALSKNLPVSVHNIGGISNLTIVTPKKEDLIAFDTGPGNSLIDLAVQETSKTGLSYDKNGQIASKYLDKIQWEILKNISKSDYFLKRPPKSTGRELFNSDFLKQIPGDGDEKIVNATAFTAMTMAHAYRDFVFKSVPDLKAIYLTGGGTENSTLIYLFQKIITELTKNKKNRIKISRLPKELAPSQYVEAMAFARLGFEALLGRPVSLSSVTGASSDAIGAGVFPGKNYLSLLQAVLKLTKH